ncbi:MAG: hypothetical protein KA347_06680 [Bacteroidia bacterium]|nr:hypothetical protein [Bacteroidia bacterium]
MNKEPSQVKKSKDEILMQVCNITDKEEWSYVEHITPIQALKAMEEYRSQASDLPSDGEANLPSFLYMNGHNQIAVGVHGDSVVTDEWNQFIASRDARIKELEEDIHRINLLNKQYSDFRNEVLKINDEMITILDDKYFPF